ncbi:MAG: hydroxymethylbilane synthase [Anaerolineales bacterium]
MRIKLRFATRPSKLARWQTSAVIEALHSHWPSLQCEQVVMKTRGDIFLDQPLPDIGGKGLFTAELDDALSKGEIDAIVHSLKDLPIEERPGLMIGAIPRRGPSSDVLLNAKGLTLSELPSRSRVGTSSLRRQAQLLAYRSDLQVKSLRGNIDTRIRKMLVGDYDAIVLASAGVTRLEMEDCVAEELPFEVMLPAPGQGALAVQCRSNDGDLVNYLAAIEHVETRRAVSAERAFLSALGGGCSLPVGAYATLANGQIEMQGAVISPDGQRQIRVSGRGDHPIRLGARLATEAFALGAKEVLNV